MTESGGYYERLKDSPNPHSEGETKGTLEEFRENAARMARDAIALAGVDWEAPVEEDRREWLDNLENKGEK